MCAGGRRLQLSREVGISATNRVALQIKLRKAIAWDREDMVPKVLTGSTACGRQKSVLPLG